MLAIDLRDRVAIVTGASGGIGRAISRVLTVSGAHVVGVDLRAAEPPATALAFIETDVTDFAAVGRCVRQILAAHKAIDILVNNAGISRDAPVWKMSEQAWDRVLAVNLKGAFNFIHHVAPCFRETRQGKIVNIASINGLRGKFGLANYSASKAGLIGLTRTIARELGRSNVNVNAIAPGFIRTPLTEKLEPKYLDAAEAETTLGRLGTPEDIANTVAFLCSDLARHISGAVLTVDGGQTT